jgi:hypothetical protein
MDTNFSSAATVILTCQKKLDQLKELSKQNRTSIDNNIDNIDDNNIIHNIENIDNKIINKIIDNFDKDKSNCNNRPPTNTKYALKPGFNYLRSETSFTAKEIADQLQDIQHYAFYYYAVKNLGPSIARTLLKETQDDVSDNLRLGKQIRNPAALFNYKVQKKLGMR